MSIDSDLIRGHVDTIILRTLAKEDKYGYEIIDDIQKKSNGTYEIKQPTLYSCLKRLENQGLISSYWVNSDIGGRRHYYKLTEKGREEYNNNMSQWVSSRSIIDQLLGDSAEYTTDENTKIDGELAQKKVTEDDIRTTNPETDNSDENGDAEASPETNTEDDTSTSEQTYSAATLSQISMNSEYAVPDMVEEAENPYLNGEGSSDAEDEKINLTSDVDYSVIADYYKTDDNQIDIFTPTALEEELTNSSNEDETADTTSDRTVEFASENEINEPENETTETEPTSDNDADNTLAETIEFEGSDLHAEDNDSATETTDLDKPDNDSAPLQGDADDRVLTEENSDIFVTENAKKQSTKFNIKDYKTSENNYFNSGYGETDQDASADESDDDFDYSVFDSDDANPSEEETTPQNETDDRIWGGFSEESKTEDDEADETSETDEIEENNDDAPRFGFYDSESEDDETSSYKDDDNNDEETTEENSYYTAEDNTEEDNDNNETEYSSSALNWGNGFEEPEDNKDIAEDYDSEENSGVNFVMEPSEDEDDEPEFVDNRYSSDYLLDNIGYTEEKHELANVNYSAPATKEDKPVAVTDDDTTQPYAPQAQEADLFIDNKRSFVPQYTDNDSKELLNTLSAYGSVKLRPEPARQKHHTDIDATSLDELRYNFESEGINVREYKRREPESGDTKYYCLVNKLKMVTSLISYGALAILLLISYFIAKAIGYTNFDFRPINGMSGVMHFVLAGLIFLIVPAVYTILYFINPTKKVRPKYSAKVGIIFALLLFVQCLVIIYVLNISLGLMSFSQIDYNHLNWFVPSICSFYIILHSVTYSILYKTKKFHV